MSENYCKGFIRNMYALTGDLTAIKESKLYDKIKSYARSKSMRVNDYIYSVVGFKPTATMGEEDVAKATKYLLQGDIAWIKKMADSLSLTPKELLGELGKTAPVGKLIVNNVNDHSQLLSEFFKKDIRDYLSVNGKSSTLKDFFKTITMDGLDSVSLLNKAMTNGLTDIVLSHLPQQHQGVKESKFIGVYSNKLYGFGKVNMKEVVVQALQLTIGVKFEFHSSLTKSYKDIVKSFVGMNALDFELSNNTEKLWEVLLHASLKYNTTIANLIVSQGFVYNDMRKTVSDDIGVIHNGRDLVAVVNQNMKEKTDVVLMNKEQFYKLFSMDILGDFVMEDRAPLTAESRETLAFMAMGVDKKTNNLAVIPDINRLSKTSNR